MSSDGSKLKKDQRKESILNTALKVFSENGLDATTMRLIAKEEGISEPMLYRFFKNKYELLLEILQSKASVTIDAIEELKQSIIGMIPDPRVSLPIILKLLQKRLLEHKDVVQLFRKEGANMPEHFKKMRAMVALKGMKGMIPEFVKKFQALDLLDSFTNYFNRCKDAGNLRKELDPKYCANYLFNILRAIPMQHFRPDMRFLPSIEIQETTETIDAMLDILLYGLIPSK
jgi:AcrR family transcriptional regulator